MRKVRNYIFLKDVFFLSLSAFGGPAAHLALFFKILVHKRAYLTEAELTDLNSFCQILPGPASTQTLTAIGFKIGGPRLAFLTLLVWILPAVTIMTLGALCIAYLEYRSIPLGFTKYLMPISVGFVAFAAYRICVIVVNTRTAITILIITSVASYWINNPAIFPIVLILGGFVTAFRFKKHPREEQKPPLKIAWANLILYGSIFVGAALLGYLTHALPIRLFENFFRNGSLTFGGGQALIALLYKEFVVFKHYLTNEEFLSGYALLQVLPGPLFSFSSFIGALSMREYGLAGQLLGSIAAATGIFLPGTILIFFIIRFWERLKAYRVIRASLEGINAASAGIVISTAFILFQPLEGDLINHVIVAATFCILLLTKIPSPLVIAAGLCAGLVF